MLTRAVIEMILGDESMRDVINDLLWSICEETTWVLPAHEEQGPDFWELKPSPRQHAWGAHTALTREPDSIDLFAAETGASLAETVYLLGDRLAPEVCQRVRQEVERHIFKPYLAYGRKHWWYKGALNWNGVCNGSIGLAFMRLERDPQTLLEAISQVLEGFEAYIATGFEADGGSIEGLGYWNYGLMYYVTLAELLRERTGGSAGSAGRAAHGRYCPLPAGDGAFARDSTSTLAMRSSRRPLSRASSSVSPSAPGLTDLRHLILPAERLEGLALPPPSWPSCCATAPGGTAKPSPSRLLPARISTCPPAAWPNLPVRPPQGKPVMLAAKAGHNDGHHSHTDIATFIYHIDGESLLCDPGRGRYSKEYFRQNRYQNIFCNSIGHNVPRIGGQLQAPGPEFGGSHQYHGDHRQA